MDLNTIDDVYNFNASAISRLGNAVSGLSTSQASEIPAGQTWSLDQLVEHVAIVDEAMFKICAKLLSRSKKEELAADGRLHISEAFVQGWGAAATTKLAAPEQVQPTGTVPVEISLQKIAETDARFAELRSEFDLWDGKTSKFPHPLFGDLTAHEWLLLRGGHAMRHLKQIEARISAFQT